MDKDAFNKLLEQVDEHERRIVLKLKGGKELTVLPSEIVVVFDTRIELTTQIVFFSDLNSALII